MGYRQLIFSAFNFFEKFSGVYFVSSIKSDSIVISVVTTSLPGYIY